MLVGGGSSMWIPTGHLQRVWIVQRGSDFHRDAHIFSDAWHQQDFFRIA